MGLSDSFSLETPTVANITRYADVFCLFLSVKKRGRAFRWNNDKLVLI